MHRGMLQLQPRPISEFKASPFGIGMSVGEGNDHTLLISSDKVNLALKFPSIDTMDEKIDRAMQVEYANELEDLADEEFEEDEWEEDSDEE